MSAARTIPATLLLLALAVGSAYSAAPDPPVITGTDPTSPANNNFPLVKGTLGAGTDFVQIYLDAGCANSIAGGSADAFTSTGVQVHVFDDTVTTLYATAGNS